MSDLDRFLAESTARIDRYLDEILPPAAEPPAPLHEARTVADIAAARLAESAEAQVAVLVQARSHLVHIVAELVRRNLEFRATEIDPLGERPVVLDLLSLARALALDPELLCLDEPSSGLDPITANALDELVLQLKELLGLTILLVTHDMDSLWRVADHVALLAEGKMVGSGTMQAMADGDEPHVKEFFGGVRGRARRAAAEREKR